jgi:hypothetical protein
LRKVSGCIWVSNTAGAKDVILDEASFEKAYLEEVQQDPNAGVDLVKVSARLDLASMVMYKLCAARDTFPDWVAREEKDEVKRLLLLESALWDEDIDGESFRTTTRGAPSSANQA